MRSAFFWTALGFVGGLLGACGGDEDCETCDSKYEYCVRYTSDVDGQSDDFGCEPLPDSCTSQSDCSCLDGKLEGELAICFETAGCTTSTGILEVICPGG